MINFDISSHFEKYSNHIFYNQIPYSKLKDDVLKVKSAYFKTELPKAVGLKIQNPYWNFVFILACLISNNKAVLLSFKENDKTIRLLHEQINFDLLVEDLDISPSLKDVDVSNEMTIKNESNHLVFCFTSGSSSTPKAVALTFENFYFSSLGFIEYIKQTSNEISYLNLPHHHVGGLMVLWRAFLSGGKIIDQFILPIDYISLVPTQLKKMIEIDEDLKKLQSIKCILIGAAPLYQNLKNKCKEFGLKIFETYGMTESCSLVTLNGEVLPYRKVELNTDKCFCISGKILSPGYFQNNRFNPISPPFITNDIGELIQEKFRFLERKDLIFISGGENINPQHIEEVATKYAFVEAVCSTYVLDDKWGQLNVLLYQTAEGQELNEDDFLLFLKQNLHPHHVPKYFFKTQILQANQTKINRKTMRDLSSKLYLENIFSFEYYPSKSPNKETIIFFHGFMGDKSDHLEIALPLLNQFNLLFLDLPGHGKTSMSHFHSLEDIFLKLSQFIQIYTSKPILYGYSMGGRIALELSLHYLNPKALILESAGLGLIDKKECEERILKDQKMSLDINESNKENFLHTWYQNPIFHNYNQTDQYRKDINNKQNADQSGWALAIEKFSPAFFPLLSSNLSELEKISFPLIYICGEKDQKYLAYAKQLRLMNFKTIIISDCGHNPFKTHPSEITSHLSKTLKFLF